MIQLEPIITWFIKILHSIAYNMISIANVASYQFRYSDYKDKMICWLSYRYNVNHNISKIAAFYWITTRFQN